MFFIEFALFLILGIVVFWPAAANARIVLLVCFVVLMLLWWLLFGAGAFSGLNLGFRHG
jgi:hypothetical protein